MDGGLRTGHGPFTTSMPPATAPAFFAFSKEIRSGESKIFFLKEVCQRMGADAQIHIMEINQKV